MTGTTVANDKILVVMDAQCELCSGGARWIAKRDHRDRFRIVPMQSPLGQQLFQDHGIDPDDPASWLYLEQDTALTGFDGWAQVGQVLGGPARLLMLLRLVPRPLRARLYGVMARHRMRIFGRDDLCHMPAPEVARRLLQ